MAVAGLLAMAIGMSWTDAILGLKILPHWGQNINPDLMGSSKISKQKSHDPYNSALKTCAYVPKNCQVPALFVLARRVLAKPFPRDSTLGSASIFSQLVGCLYVSIGFTFHKSWNPDFGLLGFRPCLKGLHLSSKKRIIIDGYGGKINTYLSYIFQKKLVLNIKDIYFYF